MTTILRQPKHENYSSLPTFNWVIASDRGGVE
jgi:hypothetical protein